jgi:hypothetical protein
VKLDLEYKRFHGKLSGTILKQNTTYLYAAEYHQIISRLPNLYSRISGKIPVAARLLIINQNKYISQHNKNSLPDANSNSSSPHLAYLRKTTLYGVQYVKKTFE